MRKCDLFKADAFIQITLFYTVRKTDIDTGSLKPYLKIFDFFVSLIFL